MKIAIIPWDKNIKENSIFCEKYPGYVDSHILLKRAFESIQIELNTIDVYKDLSEVNCFLFFALDYVWLNRVMKCGLLNRAVYCSGEPSVVKPENSEEGYKKLLKIFSFILTWNEDLVDNKKIFIRNIPYYFVKDYGEVAFCKRKLLTNISGNKRSKQPRELYSERERVVSFFEQYRPDEFDLYGVGWDVAVHPSYKGIAASKTKTYHNYKFALSLENTYGVKGYITEKILDCFVAGIVPIYKGASDINNYIPKECYIDYDDFRSLADMANYLENMSEEKYNEYLINIDKFLNSAATEKFSSQVFCEDICAVIKEIKMEKKRISLAVWIKVKAGEICERWSSLSMRLRKRAKRFLIRCFRRDKIEGV